MYIANSIFNILIDEAYRVRLRHISKTGSDYINASFIDVSYH